MDNLTPQQQKNLKLAIGVATLVFVFWFLRSNNLVFAAMQPQVEAGKLGSPPVANAAVSVVEIIVSLGGAVLVMFTGLWKFAASSVSGFLEDDPTTPETDGSTVATEFVERTLRNEITPERRLQLQEALLICVDEKDHEKIVTIAEMLAGLNFFPKTLKRTKDGP